MVGIFDVKGEKLFGYIFIILSLIIPGFGIISIKDWSLINNLDIYRIILLSILFSLPIFLIGVLTTNYIEKYLPPKKTKSEDEALDYFSLASFLSVSIFYMATFLNWFMPKISPNLIINNFNPITIVYLYSIISALSTILVMKISKFKC